MLCRECTRFLWLGTASAFRSTGRWDWFRSLQARCRSLLPGTSSSERACRLDLGLSFWIRFEAEFSRSSEPFWVGPPKSPGMHTTLPLMLSRSWRDWARPQDSGKLLARRSCFLLTRLSPLFRSSGPSSGKSRKWGACWALAWCDRLLSQGKEIGSWLELSGAESGKESVVSWWLCEVSEWARNSSPASCLERGSQQAWASGKWPQWEWARHTLRSGKRNKGRKGCRRSCQSGSGLHHGAFYKFKRDRSDGREWSIADTQSPAQDGALLFCEESTVHNSLKRLVRCQLEEPVRRINLIVKRRGRQCRHCWADGRAGFEAPWAWAWRLSGSSWEDWQRAWA